MEMNDFLSRLASKEPVPGGGAASALVAMVASSLSSMVTALTLGRKGYDEYQEELTKISENMTRLRGRLESLMKEDEEAFNAVAEVWKLPRNDDKEKEIRRQRMQAALKTAIQPPWKIANLSAEIMEAAVRLISIGNKNAVTDAACGLLFAHSAAEGAILNISINVDGITDENLAISEREKLAALQSNIDRLRNSGISNLSKLLRSSPIR